MQDLALRPDAHRHILEDQYDDPISTTACRKLQELILVELDERSRKRAADELRQLSLNQPRQRSVDESVAGALAQNHVEFAVL